MRLLDTNILSETIRSKPDPLVVTRLLEQPSTHLFASELTRFELRRGACLRDNPFEQRLWQRLTTQVLPLVQWLPIHEAISLRAAELSAELRRNGREIGIVDTFLAATAQIHGLIMVTRNVRHFENIPGLLVENWFSKNQ